MVGSARRATRSLHARDFRLYFAGQGISLVGTWMQRVAMAWLVYRLTGSALVLGLVGFVGRIPTLALAPFAGVAADRWDRRRILYLTQALSMLQALVLAALVLAGVVQVWHVLALAGLLGVLDSFDIPARQSLFVRLIDDPADLGNAIALNSSVFNLARLIGPSIAGILIAVIGEGWVFALNGLTYLSMLAALVAMRVRPVSRPDRTTGVLGKLREGFAFAWGFPAIRAVLLLITTSSFFAVPFVVLMPIFASDVLGGGPGTLGLLMTAQGVGALAGALFLATRPTTTGLGPLIALAATLFGGGLLAFGASGTLWASVPVLVVAGFGLMVQSAASNTFLQSMVGEDMRGRIMSLYTMAFAGTLPLGSLYAGWVADRIGAPATVMIGGAIALVAAALFRRRLPGLRRDVAERRARGTVAVPAA
ncbi:MAG: MFS transporter [Gemmatimonadetes bacterium]|nr:MFS transporter [Gemmatimonadota bacterium]NIQ54343.1 MFS transporter [Gemmatimonadota bacterium]NIU74553.1 MFS transporter [Gammaproteobacteria bacterium]NIX44488.1 MFS transporter [Gemmatimonadota bacterium]NIY08718.1 MFS transporter [Gemmatimonadota bacterium]